MILATSAQLALSRLYARKTSPKLPLPSFQSSEMQQGVPVRRLTRTRFLGCIANQQADLLQWSVIDQVIQRMSRVNQAAEARKIFCAYHPNQILTNFCCDPECLMPLCPNCIVEHTEQHFLENNKPTYVNLQEALAETRQKCYQHIVVFEELSRSNDRIFDYLSGLRESIHNQLQEDKEEIVKELDNLFEVYEEKLFTQTVSKYRQLEVYDKKETINITEFISEQVETLHDQIAILKGENCLAGLITYFANDGRIYDDSIKELNEYVIKHRKAGKILINTDPDKLLKTFENFCENNLVIEFVTDERKKQEEGKLNESRTSKEGSSLLGRLGKKHTQSYSKQNNINHNNSDYRNIAKKSEDFYKIDPTEGKYSRNHQSKANISLGYSRPTPASGIRPL